MAGSVRATGPSSGSWTATFDSELASSKWGQIQWTSWLCGDAKIAVTASSSVDGSTYSSPPTAQNGVAFTLADGRYLRVAASFEKSSKGESPMLSDLTVATRDRPLTAKPNAPPVVNAGKGFTISLPNKGHLVGSVCDDGLPHATISPSWSKISGPGTVTFLSPSSEVTDVAFGAAGAYVLRLTGTDGDKTATSDVTVQVDETNLAPVVDAGGNKTTTMPEAITLVGTASDDGRPAGGSLTTTWSKVSGPGTVTFGSPSALTTTASFSFAGTYVLRLTANDTLLSTSSDVTVTVSPAPTPNTAPVVRAGSNLTIELGSAASLAALVTDDGLPGGATVTQQWTQTSGPGTTTFADATATSTTAQFSAVGTYVLRLTATDTVLSGYGELAITVISAGDAGVSDPAPVANKPPTVKAGPNLATTLPSASVTLSGTVTDDGLPTATLTQSWSKVSGPGSVTFGSATSATSTATFSAEGLYVLRLSASDGQFVSSADMQVVVSSAASTNKAPLVSAGASQTITLPTRTATLAGTVTDDGLPTGGTLTKTWTLVSGPASVSFGSPSSLTTLATFSAAGSYVLRLSAFDGQLTGSGDVVVTVLGEKAPNTAPSIVAGAPQTITFPSSSTATLVATVTDDGLPVGGTLQTQWLQASGPAIATISGDVAAFTALGDYTFRVFAFDGELMSSALVKVSVVAPGPANTPPIVDAGLAQVIDMPAAAKLSSSVRDDGLPVSGSLTMIWSKVSGPGSVTFSAPTAAATNASFDTAGTYVLRLTASDGLLFGQSDVTVTVRPTNLAPVVNAGAAQTLAFPSLVTAVAGTMTDDGLPTGATVSTTWSLVSGPSTIELGTPGALSTWVKFPGPGTYVLRLTGNDTQKSASSDVTITVGAPDGTTPVVTCGAELTGAQITKPTAFKGSVFGGAWRVELALGDEETFDPKELRKVATGTSVVTNDTLATIDPTLLLNGTYTVRLTSTTTSGSASCSTTFTVDKQMKVGVFALAFNDLSIPTVGFSMEVQRTYDNRDKRSGDFGVGWNLGVRNVRVEKSVNLGKYWYQWKDDSGFFTEYCVRPQRSGQVSITLPAGKVYRFEEELSPSCQTLYPVEFADIAFKPMAGTYGKLTPTDGAGVHIAQTVGLPGPAQLQDLSFNVWNPSRFTLTDEDGIQYVIDQKGGIEKVIDLDGNWLQVSSGGLVHSSGKSVSFARDGSGRITSITDPNGKVLRYTYDALGNLETFTNREGEVQRYAYDSLHDLTSITDARGVTPAQYAYDGSGRLTGVTDASSNATSFSHDLSGKREIVTDALGHTTVYEYDDAGNVLKTTDALGKVTSFTYDSNDNKVSETDALGHTKTWSYDALSNNLLAETDALGNTTTYTYGNNRRLKTRKDPLGRVTTDTWDYYWNQRLSHTDAAGVVTGYLHESGMLAVLDTTTDARGGITRSWRANDGSGSFEEDALGHKTSSSYDKAGNRLSETRVRTKSDGTSETLVTSWSYDTEGRVLKTTYPDGSTTSTTYNKIGKPLEVTDQLGRVTKHEYDSLGRQTKTVFPDGTSESTSYDALGRRATSTDRAGRVTSYAYDFVGRLLSTTHPDGTTTSSVYDATGKVIATTNELGHTTTYGYDAAGRRISVTDALGNVSTMAYDAAGQLLSSTDPLGHTTSYTYDAAGRQTKTTYADGTTELTGYDAIGNRTSKTDQAGVVTSYAYDLAGRLTTVTDALGGVTSYAYDELGQKVTQTDANGHTTKYGYDSLGHRILRTLPLGQTEALRYDVRGNLTSRRDFNGKTTTFGYDANDRLISRTPDASFVGEVAIAWTYTPTGRRSKMTDSTGTTTYSYDLRDRLLLKSTPYGTLYYTRDNAGHVKTVRSDASDGVAVDYAWNDLGQIATVVDAATSGATSYAYDKAGRISGWTQPNGVATSLGYDAANHLKTVSVKDASATVLASYTYVITPTGNRTGVTEASGRTIAWTYDKLYRLTSETISGAASANGAIGYTYDAVGNRLTRTSTVPGVSATTSTFDANDRTTADTWNDNGNMLTRDGRTQTFDSLDRLVSSSGSGPAVKVTYDGDGNRVAEDVGGLITTYLVDDQNPTRYAQVLEERVEGAVTKAYVFSEKAISQRAKVSGGTWATHFFEHDGHGSVVALTDPAGAVTDTWEYDAFGTVVARTGTTTSSLQYSGEWLDEAQGLQYLRARWYAAGAGRLVTVDPWLDGLERAFGEEADAELVPERLEPWLFHPYAYGSGDPVGKIDPSGWSSDDTLPGQLGNTTIQAGLASQATAGLARYVASDLVVKGGGAAAAVAASQGPRAQVWLSQLQGQLNNITEELRAIAPRLTGMFGRFQYHHLFPQSRRLAPFFQRAGISVHEFTVRMPLWLHRLLHSPATRATSGGYWNNEWARFFERNPNANAEQIYRFLGELIYQYSFKFASDEVVPYPYR